MKLSDLKKRTKIIAIDLFGETLTVTYRPSNISPDIVDNDDIATVIASIVSEWDLLGENDQPYPINSASINALPVDFLASVLQAIVADAVPNGRTPGV